MKAILLLLLVALSVAGAAIATYAGLHFVLIAKAGDWTLTEGRVIGQDRTWNVSKWHSGFCSRLTYSYRDANGDHVGTAIKPGLFQNSCSLTAAIQGQLIADFKPGQSLQVFVDSRNAASVLDQSPLLLVPFILGALGLAVAVVCIRGIWVVRRNWRPSSNSTFERDARASAARPSP